MIIVKWLLLFSVSFSFYPINYISYIIYASSITLNFLSLSGAGPKIANASKVLECLNHSELSQLHLTHTYDGTSIFRANLARSY